MQFVPVLSFPVEDLILELPQRDGTRGMLLEKWRPLCVLSRHVHNVIDHLNAAGWGRSRWAGCLGVRRGGVAWLNDGRCLVHFESGASWSGKLAMRQSTEGRESESVIYMQCM